MSRPKIRRLVQNFIKFEPDIERLFNLACKKLNYALIPGDQLRESLQYFKEYRRREANYEAPFEHYHRTLLYIILEEIQAKTGIASWTTEGRRSLKLLSGRYVVMFKGNWRHGFEALVLHDIFYGIEKELKLTGSTSLQSGIKNKILVIDSDHVILFNERPHELSSTIYLTQLNLEEGTFTVKDAKSFVTRSARVVLDVNDRRKFAVVMMEEKLPVQTGRFEDRWIRLNPKVSTLDTNVFQRPVADANAPPNFNALRFRNNMEINDDADPDGIQNIQWFMDEVDNFNMESERERVCPFGFRLFGNKLQAFIVHDAGKGQIFLRFLEFQLTNKSERLQPTVLFSIRIEQEREYLNMCRCFWHGDRCYLMSDTWENRLTGIPFLAVDVTEQRIMYISPHFVGKSVDLHVGADGYLTTLIMDQNEEKLVMHRVGLNGEPDTLSTLATRAIGHYAKKCKKPELLENLWSQFPLKSRPFYLNL